MPYTPSVIMMRKGVGSLFYPRAYRELCETYLRKDSRPLFHALLKCITDGVPLSSVECRETARRCAMALTGVHHTQSVLWTIGHSTRSAKAFLALLEAHAIRQLVDVRVIPFSRRNPQFHSETLARDLDRAGIVYRSMKSLGGRRKVQADSVNLGWRNAGFRGYADYMQTSEFWDALEELLALSQASPTSIMCAEAVPWRCHRSLIADAALIRGWTVDHIMSAARTDPHLLTPFARVLDGRLIYPKQC